MAKFLFHNYALYFFILLQLCIISTSSARPSINVLKYGAKPNGITDSTQAFLDAWTAACACENSTMIYIPKGRYLLSPLSFQGDECKSPEITVRIDGTLVAPLDYMVLAKSENWINFNKVSGVSILGGALDAKGTGLWACKAAGNYNCPTGATTLRFSNSNNISINGLLSLNSQMFHIAINGCENVLVQRVRVIAAGDSPNTDGIHIQLSKNVTVMYSTIQTGDDCISIGPGSENLWIEGVRCGPGHGISIGSLGKDKEEPGVQNVTVTRSIFADTTNGFRIKSWARPSNGFVQGVRFVGALMRNVQNPIVIDQHYCPHNSNCPNQESGIQVSDVLYQGIRGSSATQIAVKFDCSCTNPCKDIKLQGVNLTFVDQEAQSSCSNAAGIALASMAKFLSLTVVILALLVFPIKISAAIASYNVLKYGAKPNGKTDSTQAFLDAWNAACASESSTLIYVPKGRYLLGSLAFKGDGCKSPDITIRIDGTLIAPEDYRLLGQSASWISFEKVNGVSVVGGALDAKGSPLWACKATGNNCPSGATTMSFSNSKNIKVSRLVSLNSQMFHIVINGCQDVLVQGVRVIAAGDSPNTDGIHVQLSENVVIMNSSIKTGDDCISIGPGTENLWIEGVKCGPGHGISIGSLAKDVEEPGVQNVTVKRTIFADTQNGFRIKSWARPSNGFVQGVRFIGSIMHNVQNPILIDQHYCPHNLNCPTQVSGVQISDVLYRGIRGTSATPVAIKFDCSSKNPCKGIRMEDVNLTYLNQAAQSSCSNANGNVVGQVQPNNCL
ncbi:hypothetical protein Tsubulata_049762, partial [Turnera subulata]